MKINKFTFSSIFFILFISFGAQSELTNDSHLDFQIRSFSLDRKFINKNATIKKQSSYSTGALWKFTSGYTDTLIAAGFDLDSQYSTRLRSVGNDDTLPFNKGTNNTSPHYGRIGGDLKLKYHNTIFKIGNMQPNNPILGTEDTRMLPSIAQGAVIESHDINGLLLTGGQFWSQITRQSSNKEMFYLSGQSESRGSDKLTFMGGEYNLTPQTKVSGYYAILKNIYQQNYTSFSHRLILENLPIINLSARYNQFRNDGDTLGGNIDNRSYGVIAAISGVSQTLAFSYQRMLGETGYAQLNGGTPLSYVVNAGALGFINKDEKSWSARYRYLIHTGVLEGIGVGVRYGRGTNIYHGDEMARGKESETDTVLTYNPTEGALKNFGVTLLYALVRQSAGIDANTLRLQLIYNFNIF